MVEDEEFIRDLFKRQLDLSGFTTDAFSTGKDGLSAISKNAYDLVLLDIMLPDINGLQILQNIRQNPATKNVAVVLLTNLGQDAVIKQGFELGADGYLVKAAYTPDQIVQEVKNIMQKKNAQSNASASTQPATVIGQPGIASSSPVPIQPDIVQSFPGQTSANPTSEGAGALPQPVSDSVITSQPAIPLTASEIASLAASEGEPIVATPATEVASGNS